MDQGAALQHLKNRAEQGIQDARESRQAVPRQAGGDEGTQNGGLFQIDRACRGVLVCGLLIFTQN
jgi:hypothetical protein